MGMLLLVLCVFSSQVVGQTEEVDQLHPNLDDFTSLLCHDDARMLVDLLKLAVAGRAVDTAKETIVNVLVGMFIHSFISLFSIYPYTVKTKDVEMVVTDVKVSVTMTDVK